MTGTNSTLDRARSRRNSNNLIAAKTELRAAPQIARIGFIVGHTI